MVYARAAQDGDAGYGLETELAEPDRRADRGRRGRGAGARSAAPPADDARPAARSGARRRRPTGSTARPARGSRARSPRSAGATETVGAWIALLARIGGPADPDFVDWLAVDRIEGREYRHRPPPPLARPDPPARRDRAQARARRARHLGDAEGRRARLADRRGAHRRRRTSTAPPGISRSPARSIMPTQAEVLIVTDVKRGDLAALANAYARLIAAAGGGTLGLFTAIRRLRGVHARIADRLARDGLPLYAQHVDPIDTGTLVDIFRDDPRASLIGTDALARRRRRARRMLAPGHHGGRALGQADRAPRRAARWPAAAAAYRRPPRPRQARPGVRPADPPRRRSRRVRPAVRRDAQSRLLAAFPPGVPIARVPLDEAVARVQSRLSSVTRRRA